MLLIKRDRMFNGRVKPSLVLIGHLESSNVSEC